MLCWRYCLDTPGGLQPPRICFGTCSHVGTPTPALRDTLERADLAALTQREWLLHAVRSCVKSGGVRRLCHDAVLRVLFDMLKSGSAGFEDVQMEDRWWDEGEAEAKDTRRPDVTAFNPRDRRRYVIDVVAKKRQAGAATAKEVEVAEDAYVDDILHRTSWRVLVLGVHRHC